tara:strand:- start:2422 stop:4569 length:2148 start_codon:yes stop_codon:yes gene_type:complete
MANIKKNFNFRNGVQVDDDNLLVTSTGLVGIGTTVPLEALDVRGNVRISGFTSITQANIGILTVTTIKPTEIIGAGISVRSGILTAEGTGIVTFYGDARFLQGMPTSQWQDVDVGLGFTSIYNTGGNVGVGTIDPRFTVQIGGDADSSQEGVGISSVGNIKATGIVTASSFIGPVTGAITGDVSGNVTGNLTGLVNSSGISTFGGINATGRIVATATNNVIPYLYSNQTDLPSASTYHGAVAHVHATGALYFAHAGAWWELVNKESSGVVGTGTEFYNIEALESDHLNITGVSTFNDNIDANKDLDVDGHTNLDNVSIAGVTTFSGAINADGGANIDNIQIGVTGDNEIDTSTGNLTIDSSGGTITIDDNLTISGETNAVNVVASGIITATTELNSPLIGVGTDIPANPIQVRGTGNTEIQVTSDTGIAGLTVGREPSTANINNAEFRYGGGGGFPYSSEQSLDIINYGTGNFNYHLSANNAGAAAGNFFWHKGSSNVRLMTLTNTGRLGIGLTEPTDELHVDGGATINGGLGVGGNINVTGVLIGNVQGTLTGNVQGVLSGNANATVGISTLNNLSVAGIATITNLKSTRISIGENPTSSLLNVFIASDKKVFVNDVGQVGINTTIPLDGVGVNGSSTNAVFNSIGVGVTQFTSAAVDLRDAGTATSRYMIPPKVSTSVRNSLQNLVSGAMIYNTSLNKLQVYNGSAWETVSSS